jgi:hypothetical protein
LIGDEWTTKAEREREREREMVDELGRKRRRREFMGGVKKRSDV